MKVVDTILRYPCNSMTGRDGICRARVFASSSGIGLLLTDLGDLNTGQSVTNAIESVCRTAIENGLVDAGARLVEHYERSSGGSLDAVTFSAKGSPDWVNMDRREAMDLLGCSADEFDATTASNPRLMTLIQRIRNSIDPFMDGPHLESRDVILRRMDINERKISKASVAALVEAGSSERQLQALLKKERGRIRRRDPQRPHRAGVAAASGPRQGRECPICRDRRPHARRCAGESHAQRL